MVAKNIKRLGVGATAGTNTKDVAEADWTRSGKKKILSVGRRHEEEDDVIDHDSSSDEEGRTSAVKERKRKIVSVTNNTSDASAAVAAAADAPKSKKKKKGKKERNAPPADDQDTSNDASKAKDTIENAAEAKEDVERKKPKRRKSRSKQKNIRKDHRSDTDRPSYLNVGSSGYAGRPLTKATKEKLGLGTKEKDDTFASSCTIKDDAQLDDGAAEPDDKKPEAAIEQENTKQLEDVGELSKIGDCVVGEIIVSPRGGDEKTKKKPKRRFKNC
jgi:flagellar biosynthesis GTPase FlhF